MINEANVSRVEALNLNREMNHDFYAFRLMHRVTKKQEEEKKKEITLDMLQPSRYKPNDLQQMAEDTKFTKRKSNFWLIDRQSTETDETKFSWNKIIYSILPCLA